MSARHEHLLSALGGLLEAIERKDGEGAEAAMERALQLFASTPAPGDDERLLPLLASCERSAQLFRAELGRALLDSAASARAQVAYVSGGRRSRP
jgi:hypothetical protein